MTTWSCIKSPKVWPVLPCVVVLWVFLQDFSGELQFLWWISQPFHNHFTMVPGRREKISVEINLHIHHICLLHNHQCFLRIKIHGFHVLLLFMKLPPLQPCYKVMNYLTGVHLNILAICTNQIVVKYWPHLIVLGVRDDHTGDILQLIPQVFFQLFQKNSSVVPGIEIVYLINGAFIKINRNLL